MSLYFIVFHCISLYSVIVSGAHSRFVGCFEIVQFVWIANIHDVCMSLAISTLLVILWFWKCFLAVSTFFDFFVFCFIFLFCFFPFSCLPFDFLLVIYKFGSFWDLLFFFWRRFFLCCPFLFGFVILFWFQDLSNFSCEIYNIFYFSEVLGHFGGLIQTICVAMAHNSCRAVMALPAYPHYSWCNGPTRLLTQFVMCGNGPQFDSAVMALPAYPHW